MPEKGPLKESKIGDDTFCRRTLVYKDNFKSNAVSSKQKGRKHEFVAAQ